MKKTLTQFKKSFRLFSTAALGIGMSLFALTASAQYTTPNHYVGCSYGSWYYMAAINEIILDDNSGNNLFTKAGDECNQMPSAVNVASGHFQVMSNTPSFTLSTGAEYTIKMNCINPGTYTYNSVVGIWIDLNGDQDFSDDGEFITPNSWNVVAGYNGANPGSYTSLTFTVPCSNFEGTTRMRIRANYNGYQMTAGMHSSNGTAMYYGETEDYTISIAKPKSLSASFFIPDTAYVGTIVDFVNANAEGYIGHDWDINNNGSIDYTDVSPQHIFGSTGTYSIKLVSENCLGKDSVVKSIVIVNPTAPPVADFVATKNKVELFDVLNLVDLSSNGPTYWTWEMINGPDTILVAQGGNPYVHKNPEVFTGTNPVGFPKIFPDQGMWDVCLVASNGIGSSSRYCKDDYIEVTKTSFNIGPETSLPNNIIGASEGTLYDKGGPNNNYTVPEANLEALIAPCGAQSVTINFKQFKLLANANLKVYDGVNALGTPLHTGTGFTAGNAPSGPITANSGTIYLLFNSSSGSTDSGFIANWTSVQGSGDPPVADFELPENGFYNSVFYDFMNTSQNAEGNVDFEWRVDGVIVGVGRDLENQIFYSNGSHTIKLTVTGCDGTTSSVTKTITVAHPGSPTELDFTVSNQRPASGEVVTFTAMSDKANRWEWTFFPGTDVDADGPVNPMSKEGKYIFNKPGKYTVQLIGYNSLDSSASAAAVIKANYIVVVDPCLPIISVTTSSDVAISGVKLTDATTGNVILNNPSDVGVGYTSFIEDLGVIDLNYGATYDFEIDRVTNINPMSRKIWIDWNVDGDFEDAGETVASQATGTSLTWTGSFTVPNADDAFDATTRMRIGVSYGTDINHPCGANGAPNANRIGEFEDYSVRVRNDGDVPVITLIDADTVYVEQNASGFPAYVDAGAKAFDPSQGDITSELTWESNVDITLTGIYTVTYNVEDASGNQAEPVTRTIYVVVDQTPPTITLNGVQNDTIEVGSNWADAGASAFDTRDGNLDNAIVVSGSVDPFTLGTYEVTYYVQDAQANGTTVIRTVTVVDRQAPVITNASAVGNPIWTVNTQLGSVFVDVTQVTDNYNSYGDGLSFTANPGNGSEALVDTRFKGTTEVTYTAIDESGNTTTQVIRYIVEDFQPPVIDLHTFDTVYHRVNTPYSPIDATASDNLYGTTEISLNMTSNVNPFQLGVYTDTYTATDASGNVSTKTRYVKVIDDLKPEIRAKNGPILKVGLYSDFMAIERLIFTDNYEAPATLKANTQVIFTDINTYKVGLYSAVFRTRDNSGNWSDPYTLYVEVSREELPLGIDDLDVDQLLAVTPNPTSGVLTINVDLPENEDISVEIYNSTGQKVQDVVSGSISRGTYQVDLSSNGQGIYYVRMNVRGTVITKKVMVQN